MVFNLCYPWIRIKFCVGEKVLFSRGRRCSWSVGLPPSNLCLWVMVTMGTTSRGSRCSPYLRKALDTPNPPPRWLEGEIFVSLYGLLSRIFMPLWIEHPDFSRGGKPVRCHVLYFIYPMHEGSLIFCCKAEQCCKIILELLKTLRKKRRKWDPSPTQPH